MIPVAAGVAVEGLAGTRRLLVGLAAVAVVAHAALLYAYDRTDALKDGYLNHTPRVPWVLTHYPRAYWVEPEVFIERTHQRDGWPFFPAEFPVGYVAPDGTVTKLLLNAESIERVGQRYEVDPGYLSALRERAAGESGLFYAHPPAGAVRSRPPSAAAGPVGEGERAVGRVYFFSTSTTFQSWPLAFSPDFFWTTFPSSSTSRTNSLDLDFSRRSLPSPAHAHRWLSYPSGLSSQMMIGAPSSFESSFTSSTLPLLTWTSLRNSPSFSTFHCWASDLGSSLARAARRRPPRSCRRWPAPCRSWDVDDLDGLGVLSNRGHARSRRR